uniref:Lipoprotein n=1 Tax=Ditylenchus dipsaci TaxID=166011 RepID=A0A915CZ99_9BILA
MFRYLILCFLLLASCDADWTNERVDSVPAGSPSFGQGECPPIVIARTTYNNGICDGLNCKYEVAVLGSINGATYTRLQNSCFN